MSARDIGLTAWADRLTPGDPNSPLKNTSKSAVRGYINAVADEVDAVTERVGVVEVTAASGYLGRATWTALTALTPANGTRGSVEPTDVGTHTDPVVGGTVNNAGTYTYVTGSPAGWQRIGDYRGLLPASQAEVNAGTNAVKAVTPDTLEDWTSTRWQEIDMVYIAGSGTNSSNYKIRVAQPWQKLSPTMAGQAINWDAPFPCLGPHNVELYQYDGVTKALDLSMVQAPDGGTPIVDAFAKLDRLRAVRNPAPEDMGDLPGSPYQLRQTVVPNVAMKVLSESAQTALQKPSLDKPVFIQKLAERVVMMKTANVAFDNAALRMPTDITRKIFYDIARAGSQSAVKATHFWCINSHAAEAGGIDYPYGWFLSNEGNGAEWDRDGHSVNESVLRLGLLASAASTYVEVGPAHGGLRGGQQSLILFDNVSFNGGVSAFAVGQTVVGAVTGATGVIYRLMITEAAGMSWGNGNQTGYLCMKARKGAFQAGEALKVAGVTKATATMTGYRTANLNTLAIGQPLNCAESLLLQTFDAMYSYTDVECWAGVISYQHRENVDGTEFEIIPKLGRRLKVTDGSIKPAEGDILTGAESGQTGILVVAPDSQSEGDWGDGDWAGSLFLEAVGGDFDIGEDLLVGGVPVAVVAAQVGPAIGWVNSYGPLAKLKVASFAKIPGFNAVPMGRADGKLHPNASDNYGGNSFASWWPVAGLPANKTSPIQAWHARHAEAGKTMVFDLLFADGAPATPPGDFSLCDDTQIFADDRSEGTQALAVNITSGARRNAEGKHVIRYSHRYRYGDPISA